MRRIGVDAQEELWSFAKRIKAYAIFENGFDEPIDKTVEWWITENGYQDIVVGHKPDKKWSNVRSCEDGVIVEILFRSKGYIFPLKLVIMEIWTKAGVHLKGESDMNLFFNMHTSKMVHREQANKTVNGYKLRINSK